MFHLTLVVGLVGCGDAPLPERVAPPLETGSAVETAPDPSPVETASPDSEHSETDSDTDTEVVEEVDPIDDVAVEDTAVETAPDVPDASAWLFGAERVIEIDISINPEGVASLYADPYSYVRGEVTIDGLVVPDVGVRLRGKIGSFQTLDGKPKFGIDFDKFVDGGSFFGLERLNLNNATVDPSYVREHLGYMAFRANGVPAPRTGYAWVRVNGADYGLYVSLDAIDDRMLARWFPDASGNLYDGKYVWYGGWSYTLLDFHASTYNMYQLEQGEDVGWADTLAVTEALAAPSPDFTTALSAVVDLEHHVRMVAVEHWVGQLDGYSLNQNNNWVYFDPGDGGRAHILPYDLDYAWLQDWQWGMNWRTPRGLVTAGCMSDGACRGAWRNESVVVGDTIDALDLSGELHRVSVLIEPYVARDLRDWSDVATTAAWQADLDGWIGRRSGEIRAFWGL